MQNKALIPIIIVLLGIIIIGGVFVALQNDEVPEDTSLTEIPNESGERVIGAVAEVREKIMNELNVSEGEVDVVGVTEKEWTDSCLGLGGPAESCLFVMTPGYEVKVEVNGEERTYRTNSDGSVVREEK